MVGQVYFLCSRLQGVCRLRAEVQMLVSRRLLRRRLVRERVATLRCRYVSHGNG